MGQYSNEPMYGGQAPAGPSASQWGTPGPMPGTPGYGGVPQHPGMAPVMIDQGPKWPALRTIAGVLKIVAWIEAVVGVIGALVLGVSLSATIGAGGFFSALFLLVAVAIEFLATYAGSEILLLFIAVEKNTRKY